MKLLIFYVHDFWMRPSLRTLDEADCGMEEIGRESSVLVWVHAEPCDAGREGKVVTKAIKNIKWIAGKFACRQVILHFFAHLAAESAPPELARTLVASMADRLRGADYDVVVTPFGWFTEFRIHVAGDSLAKVFVEV